MSDTDKQAEAEAKAAAKAAAKADAEAKKQAEAEAKAAAKAAKAGPEILIADQSVAFDMDGKPCTIIAGKTTARRGHPILKGREHLFKPLVVDFDVPIQAKS